MINVKAGTRTQENNNAMETLARATSSIENENVNCNLFIDKPYHGNPVRLNEQNAP
jgi:hypothetical protein